MNVMMSRHWGEDHKETDTSLTTVAKTYRQLSAWMHPDHFKTFCERSKDHHDMLHNGCLARTQADAARKTQLMTGGSICGITGTLPFPKEQKEYVL